MNKSELIAMTAENTGLTKKDAERVLNAALVKEREARIGRNPRTKESIEIPATFVPSFKPSKALKDLIGKE